MEKEVRDYVIGKTRDLLNAPSCCAEAKEAANAWLNAVGTDGEETETKKYISELKEDILPIDALIAFTESDAGIRVFGAEKAGKYHAHGIELKAAGAKYCDCPACSAAEAILGKLEKK